MPLRSGTKTAYKIPPAYKKSSTKKKTPFEWKTKPLTREQIEQDNILIDRTKALIPTWDEETAYTNQRITTRGTRVTVPMAIKSLQRIASVSHPLPIIKAHETFCPHKNENIIFDVETLENEFTEDMLACGIVPDRVINPRVTIPIKPNEKLLIRDELWEAVDSDDKPLVFLVTTPVPHATVYILHESKIYTIGFGYLNMMDDKKSNVTQHISKSFARHNAILYTSDILAPSVLKSAKIAWVDFCTREMLERIQNFLNGATSIIYLLSLQIDYVKELKDQIKSRHFIPRTNNVITLTNDTSTYLEVAEFFGDNKTFNCIKWSKYILGIENRINCGIRGDPDFCTSITDDEMKSLLNHMNNENLPVIVENIQTRLSTDVDIYSRFTRETGVSGGKTRKRRTRAKRVRRTNRNK